MNLDQETIKKGREMGSSLLGRAISTADSKSQAGNQLDVALYIGVHICASVVYNMTREECVKNTRSATEAMAEISELIEEEIYFLKDNDSLEFIDLKEK